MTKFQKVLTAIAIISAINWIGSPLMRIHKVKSSIFEGYSDTITIGEAIDNKLEDGSWKTVSDNEVSFENSTINIYFHINDDSISLTDISVNGFNLNIIETDLFLEALYYNNK